MKSTKNCELKKQGIKKEKQITKGRSIKLERYEDLELLAEMTQRTVTYIVNKAVREHLDSSTDETKYYSSENNIIRDFEIRGGYDENSITKLAKNTIAELCRQQFNSNSLMQELINLVQKQNYTMTIQEYITQCVLIITLQFLSQNEESTIQKFLQKQKQCIDNTTTKSQKTSQRTEKKK